MRNSQKATFAEVFEIYISAVTARGVKDKTIATYKQHFHAISRRLDVSLPINRLNSTVLDNMILQMRKEDIEDAAQTRISDKYQSESDEPYKIDLIKMPHHGSYTGTLYRFLRTFMPDYTIISCGEGNMYGHPHQETLDLLDSKTWSPRVYRTDRDGDIIVRSNGKELSVETSK